MKLIASDNKKVAEDSKTIPSDQGSCEQNKPSRGLKRKATTVSCRTVNKIKLQYDAPEILRQPIPYQHIRMFTDLQKGRCPIIQAVSNGNIQKQKTYILLKVNIVILSLK